MSASTTLSPRKFDSFTPKNIKKTVLKPDGCVHMTTGTINTSRPLRNSCCFVEGLSVGLFVPSLTGGGAERMILHLAAGLADAIHDVDLVVASATGPYVNRVPEDVRLIDISSPEPRGFAAVGFLPGLVRYLRREQPTALLSAIHPANVVMIIASLVARVPTRVVVSERNHLLSWIANKRGIRASL